MKVNITRNEYQTLMDMLGIASWVLNAYRDQNAPETAPHRALEQKFFALAKQYGFENLVAYDQKEDRYYPTAEYEEDGPVLHHIDKYNDETFWEELVERLAMRDVLRLIGPKEFHGLAVEDRLQKLEAAIVVYEEEFAQHGLNRLVVDA